MKRIAVIMAGGGGTRFWPLSRHARPKQLISLASEKVMINETVDHYESVILRGDTYIVTNREQEPLMTELLYPDIERSHILAEPLGRNTAPCILYAALVLKKTYGDALMAVLPSDHYIADLKEYRRVLKLAFDTAESTNRMVTIGLWPTYPATGFGYIRFSDNPVDGASDEIRSLLRFVEKPELLRAKEYLSSGRYLWNSGMFVWKVSVILDAFREYMPKLYGQMLEVYDSLCTDSESEAIADLYPQLESQPVDYGIMEKAENVLVIPAEFGWNDVGTWDALDEISEPDQDGNVIRGDYLGVDSHNCIVYGEKRLVATVGVEDLIIVDTGDAILVCDKKHAQEVKNVVEELKRRGRTDLI